MCIFYYSLAEFVPREYVRIKGVEKAIFAVSYTSVSLTHSLMFSLSL